MIISWINSSILIIFPVPLTLIEHWNIIELYTYLMFGMRFFSSIALPFSIQKISFVVVAKQIQFLFLCCGQILAYLTKSLWRCNIMLLGMQIIQCTLVFQQGIGSWLGIPEQEQNQSYAHWAMMFQRQDKEKGRCNANCSMMLECFKFSSGWPSYLSLITRSAWQLYYF